MFTTVTSGEGMYKIGTIELGTEVDITDPCYDADTWCRMTTKCQPGTYTGYAYVRNEGEWGMRVTDIFITKDDDKDEIENQSDMEKIGRIGVDAGMAGFFNNKPDFHKDNDWMDFLVSSGVFKSYDEYDYSKCFYCVDYGVFSSSGYGDGSYDVYANADRTAFNIVFI